uniref:Uncharacterized protein n=1 Tax=Anguilla anguilla TaxID=7936 RepID=A0A0E9S9D5_ANGAN
MKCDASLLSGMYAICNQTFYVYAVKTWYYHTYHMVKVIQALKLVRSCSEDVPIPNSRL